MVTAKRLIRIARAVADCETLITGLLREGLHWPVAGVSRVSTRAADPDSPELSRLEFTTPAPLPVYVADMPASVPPVDDCEPAASARIVLARLFASLQEIDDADRVLVLLVGTRGELAVIDFDQSPESSVDFHASWFALNAETLKSDESIIGTYLRRLSWPQHADSLDANEWKKRWRKAFDKTELQNRFLRMCRLAAESGCSPAELEAHLVDQLLGRADENAGAVPFMRTFPFTVTEDTDLETQLAIDPAMLAALHEAGLHTQSADEEGTVSRGKQSGSYFTPRAVATFMCREALREYLAGCLTRFNGDVGETNRRKVEMLFDADDARRAIGGSGLTASESRCLRRAVDECRVCDPAVGGGALLVAMLQELTTIAHRLDREIEATHADAHATARQIVRECLFGVDIDVDAIRVCRLRLAFAVESLSARQTLNETERSIDMKRNIDFPQTRIQQGDALFDSPQAMFGDQTKFDIVIANPPYRSFGLRGNRNARREWAARVRERFPGSAEYKISLYALFFELGLNLAGESGVLCYLTPDSFLLGRYFSKLRRLLLERTDIRRLVMFANDFWTGGVVGRPTISLLRVGEPEQAVDAALVRDAAAIAGRRFRRLEHTQSEFAANPHARFRLFFSETAREFVRAMEADSVTLAELARITTGVRSRSGQKRIVAQEQRGPDWKPGLISGAQVRPFLLMWRGDYLEIASEKLYAGGWDPKIVASPKILMRQTGDSLIAAIDVCGHYHLNNVHALSLTSQRVSLAYLCALLNSRLMNRYYHLISLERGRQMAQTDIETIGLLPIRIGDPDAVARIERLVKCGDVLELKHEIDAAVEAIYDPLGRFRAYLRSDELYPDETP